MLRLILCLFCIPSDAINLTYGNNEAEARDVVPTIKENDYDDDGKIVGGQLASNGQFPYQCSLQLKCGSNKYCHFCGGSILNSMTVVTAAHCAIASGVSASTIRIVTGTNGIYKGGSIYYASRIIPHPNYNVGHPKTNDIALIKLTQAISFNNAIQPVSLPNGDPDENDECNVSGWGVTVSSSQTPSNDLRYALVKVTSFSYCQSKYGSSLDSTMICAGTSDGKDACQGDSGGPLVDRRSGKLVGVVSWGRGCGDPDYPGVYCNVARFVSWIQQKLIDENC